MILSEQTIQRYGYNPDSLSKKSDKSVVYQCDYCGTIGEKKMVKITGGRSGIDKDSCKSQVCIGKKRKETFALKYAGGHPLRDDRIRQQVVQTNLQKYGVTNVAKAPQHVQKAKQTNKSKYGVEHPMQLEEFVKKSQETYASNHDGAKTHFHTPEYRQSMKEKFGVENPNQCEEIRNKIRETCLRKYGKECSLLTPESMEKSRITMMERYGKPYPTNQYGAAQAELVAFLNSLSPNFSFQSNRNLISPKEIDAYDENAKVAFEYCGLYWHSELYKDDKYHVEKMKLCEQKQIRLVTIFEDEWIHRKPQVKSFLRSMLVPAKTKYMARKCQVSVIDNALAMKMYDTYHVQGKPKSCFLSIGIYHQGQLLGCMSFSKHHRQSDSTFAVLNRLVFVDDVQVTGGASRMLAFAEPLLRDSGFNRIVSWSDNRWSSGNVYVQCGFKLDGELGPDYSYVSGDRRVSKQRSTKKRLGASNDQTEHQRALQLGLCRIWDCGKKRWVRQLTADK